MKLLGIDFEPVDTSLKHRLETLAAGAWFFTVSFGGGLSTLFCIYLLYTRFWWLSLLYTIWIYLDRNTCETGGRSIDWVNHWKWWQYGKEYYSSKLTLAQGFTVDPKRNYLFCCFPHGVIPMGPYNAVGSKTCDFHRLYPTFRVKTAVLRSLFFFPFTRELALAQGCISCTGKSISYVLSRPEGGQIVLLWPGGAEESFYSKPGQYKFVVKNRKGFVRLALMNGTPLVPVISFGECDVFNQIEGPNLRKIQAAIKKLFGFAPIIFNGRGLFQNTFGIIPRRKSITTVVGRPIEVIKDESPNHAQIEELHGKFVQELSSLFEEYKYKYLDDPQNKHLELV